jgi:hypothetical protein
MDLPQTNPIASNSDPATVSAVTGIEHIMQEMYKKNQELNDRNKTLALLRNIDEIVLSTVTDLDQVSQKVADLLVKDEFKFVTIHMVNGEEKCLSPISLSLSFNSLEKDKTEKYLNQSILTSEKENVLVKTLNTKKVQMIKDISQIFGDAIEKN